MYFKNKNWKEIFFFCEKFWKMVFVSQKLNEEYFKNKIIVECYKDVKGVYKSSTLRIDIRGLIS